MPVANLDLSDAFDPDFFIDVMIKRPDLRLNENGIYEEVGFSMQSYKAVVIPNDARASTEPTNFNVTSSIQVYFKFAPTVDIQTVISASDYIIYAGNTYKVNAVAKFLYGQTFVRALAELVSEYD